jgi:hypothetical protein
MLHGISKEMLHNIKVMAKDGQMKKLLPLTRDHRQLAVIKEET